MFARIQDLHRERVDVEKPAGDGLALLGDRAIKAILRQHFLVRLKQRAFQLDGAAQAADVAQIRPHARSVGAHSMALPASALAFEDGLAASGVAMDGCAVAARSEE